MDKSSLVGMIISIQPRIRLLRSVDEASLTYLGYEIRLERDGEKTIVSICISKKSHAKHQFKVNDVISCECLSVPVPDKDIVDYYKVSKLKVIYRGEQGNPSTPRDQWEPWVMTPPDLDIYKERGHRRLEARSYAIICSRCIWGCRIPVEIIFDKLNSNSRKKYRFETVCYGPLSCKLYKAGPNRVENRRDTKYVEED